MKERIDLDVDLSILCQVVFLSLKKLILFLEKGDTGIITLELDT